MNMRLSAFVAAAALLGSSIAQADIAAGSEPPNGELRVFIGRVRSAAAKRDVRGLVRYVDPMMLAHTCGT
jgi:hypothetical protein